MKLKLLAIAAAGAASMAAAGAHAKTMPLTFTDGVAFGGDLVSGNFTDDYDFTVPSSNDTFTFTFSALPPFAVSDPGLQLFTSTGGAVTYTVMPASSPAPGSTSETLTANGINGSYDLRVTGSATNAGTYSFIAQEVSAAPEPATWALMIVGVGLMGSALRYTRRSGVATAA